MGPAVQYARRRGLGEARAVEKFRSRQDILEKLGTSPPELDDEFISFFMESQTVYEPPRKRQKLGTDRQVTRGEAAPPRHGQMKNGNEIDHIVVKHSSWEIKCAGSSLSKHKTPLEREAIKTHISWAPSGNPRYIDILALTGYPLFRAQFSQNLEGIDDAIILALKVTKDSTSSAKSPIRLWTETGAKLFERDGSDYLQLTFTVKWNVTTSPYHITNSIKKTSALTAILHAYFPDPNVSLSETWCPQDFYQSVHSPNKDDDVAASIETKELGSSLYPFQKRAVQWLLRKEGVEWSSGGVRSSPMAKTEALPSSFIKVVDAHGKHCYVSHLLGIVTLDITPFAASGRSLKGGILAEEMGLGKTVEMISLITLHKRPIPQPAVVMDDYIAQNVVSTSATLIITPPSILPQWISEISRHSPSLKVMHYKGIRAENKTTLATLVDTLAASDIVISTYSVLAAEINFTSLNPEKSLRRESKYPRPKSPLMQLSWWRVIIDEAQMIETGVSKAAVVSRMIPRINAWCVTGTPVRKDVNDLLGLLIFLRLEPYASVKHVWSSLISSNKHEFRKLFGWLALRHSKRDVRDELRLPAQRRYVITMPFTPIEEQHYQELFNRMCEEVGLDTEGAPLLDDWESELVADIMRKWLVRLRQTALHPEVGGRNRRALGYKDGPLRTVDQVLNVMMEQTDVAIRTDQRGLLTSKLKRGQLFENSPRVKEALAIWDEATQEALVIVEECREQLRQEISSLAADGAGASKIEGSRDVSGDNSDSSDEQELDVDPSSRLSVFRNRLRAGLEVLHMAVFFRANAYFQIKSNEEFTKPESPEFESLEKLETEGYETAKKLRREILQEIFGKADRLMRKVAKRANSQTFVEIPEFLSKAPKGGIESRPIMEKLDTLAVALDAQADVIDDWREQTIQILLKSLVDEDEGEAEITGEEYEESTKTQEEVMVFVQALRAVIGDRHDSLTGQENKLIEYDVKTALRLAKVGEGAFPEKIEALLARRQEIRPTKDMGSMRGIVTELRGLVSSLRPDAEGGSTRAQNELALVEKQLFLAQKQLSEQTKATVALEKEVELFTSVMNARLEYYRQLQQVSDMVAPYEGRNDEQTVAKMLEDEEKLARKIAVAKSKRRYLDHLREEAANPQEQQRICVICRETFEIGALTVCGHVYCKECIRMWWHTHHNCPVCKKRLIQADLHEITYKPQQLSIQAEEVHEITQGRTSPLAGSRKSAIYSEISKNKLAEIKNIELDGPSFTTKIDTLARHLIWLRETDPGAKSIIYSQFKDFLQVLANAFTRYRIGFSSIDKPDGIEKFKRDPSIECFLLHARAHSSGLNLVNASHVFLCEPLLNTALELQAIARVDRIGQHQETNVWLYLVDGTVEESIHELSVKRRMEHIGHTQPLESEKGKAKELSADEVLDKNLEEANSMELQQASLTGLLAKGSVGGEMIEKEDLWACLFGASGQRQQAQLAQSALGSSQVRFDSEVKRHLAAEAAEGRRDLQEGEV